MEQKNHKLTPEQHTQIGERLDKACLLIREAHIIIKTDHDIRLSNQTNTAIGKIDALQRKLLSIATDRGMNPKAAYMSYFGQSCP